MRPSRIPLLLASALLGLGPGLLLAGPPALAAAGDAVTIVNFDYQPNAQTIAVGTTITWTNTADRPHTVTDRGGTFDTNPVSPRQSASVTFSVPGTYHYFCRINPARMNGVITVTGDSAGAPVNRVEAIDPALPGERLRFNPDTLTVRAGSTVLVANVGGKPHTFTADDGSFDSGVVTAGAEAGRFAGTNASVVLTKPGTHRFHCEIHPQAMTGSVRVEGQPQPGPAPPSEAARQASVQVVDFAFKPAQASVAPGGKVTWRNDGSAPHTASFDDLALETGTLQPGSTGTLNAPDKPGSYSYRCAIHPGRMRAVLVVVGQNVADPTRPVSTRAAPAAVVAGNRGPGAGISGLALGTAVAAAFLGGFGIAMFARPRRRPGA
jgi:plastocyanin